MRLLAPLFAAILFATPVFSMPTRAQDGAQNAAHHVVHVEMDPAKGEIQVRDHIQMPGQGRIGFALSPAFVIKALNVDGVSQAPARKDANVFIDLGSSGPHTISIETQAKLSSDTQHGQAPFLGADGGFLSEDWLAHPRGFSATWEIKGETPSGQKWLTPGRLSAEEEQGGRYRATFTQTHASAPPLLITGPFHVSELQAGAVRVRTYFHAELTPLSAGYLKDAARYIDHYANKVGSYPYAGFAMVSAPVPVGLGLPGMTYMGRRVLALPFIRTTSLPHEVLHNWWGNAVEVDYARGNWAEGLTTYLADHAQAASLNQDGGTAKRVEWLRNYAALPSTSDHPVTAFRSKTHDASQVVGYDKVAYIFHMLKVRLGGVNFDKAIQRFYADNQGGTAGWADIQAAFETTSGEDLNTFFDAWLKRAGAPELRLEDVQVEGLHLSFTLTQNQDGAAYPLTLSADIETLAGDERVRLDMNKKRQRFSVQTNAKPLALSLDPDFDVFRRLDAVETPPIFRDVTLNGDTRLITPGDHKHAIGLGESLMQRPIPRLQAIPALPFKGTLIVAGLKVDVLAFLEQSGLPRPPQSLDAKADALAADAWAYVVREASGRTTLVAMAADSQSLAKLARVLPHYKRRSFVIMTDGKVTSKGTWPPQPGPLSVRLQ